MNKGWIKLHRGIRDNWVWDDKAPFDKRAAWIDILLMVNHKTKKVLFGNNLIIVKRGERITSLRKLSERWKWSRTKVRSFLKLLEKDDMIATKKDHQKTTIKVCNYSDLQNNQKSKKDTKKTRKRHGKDTEKTRKNINNNVKNEKNVKNDKEALSKQVLTASEFKDKYNSIAKKLNFPKAIKLSTKRRKKIKTRVKHFGNDIILMFDELEKQGYLSKESWFNIDYIIRNDENIENIINHWMSWKQKEEKKSGIEKTDIEKAYAPKHDYGEVDW